MWSQRARYSCARHRKGVARAAPLSSGPAAAEMCTTTRKLRPYSEPKTEGRQLAMNQRLPPASFVRFAAQPGVHHRLVQVDHSRSMHEVQTWSYSDLAGTLPRVMAGVRALASASVWAVVARCLLLTRSTPGGIAVENSHAVASMTLQRFTTVVRGPLVFPPWLIGPESGLRRGNLTRPGEARSRIFFLW
jgi:hypothetical protein